MRTPLLQRENRGETVANKGLPEMPRTLAVHESEGASIPWLPSPCTRLSRAPCTQEPPTPTSFMGGLLTSTHGPSMLPQMHSTRSWRWRFANHPSRALRYPDRGQGRAGGLSHPLGWPYVYTSLGQLIASSRLSASVAAPIILVGATRRCRIFRGRGALSRRLNPASCALTM
jgi:hypothetical protein